MKIAAFTGGATVPSARFRVRQHIPGLRQHGLQVEEMGLRTSKYPPQNKLLRPLWAANRLAELLPNVVKSHSFDVVLLQREMLSSFVTLEPFTKKPRILDVDDAIFLQRGGAFARRLAQISDRIICGNSYLADWFSNWNSNISIIPTAVDTDRYIPVVNQTEGKEKTIIGWIGTSANLKYIYGIESALAKVVNRRENTKLVIICDQRPIFRLIDINKVEYIKWSQDIEIASIQNMDIGIMPLENSIWTQGKCSFKMLQYMSCGLPVVVSPVGMNNEVLKLGNVGFGSTTNDSWIDSLDSLLECASLRVEMGAVGRQIAVNSFSLHKIQRQIAKCIKEV